MKKKKKKEVLDDSLKKYLQELNFMQLYDQRNIVRSVENEKSRLSESEIEDIIARVVDHDYIEKLLCYAPDTSWTFIRQLDTEESFGC